VRGRGLGRSVAEGWGAAVAKVRDESGERRGIGVRGGEFRQRSLGALVGIRKSVDGVGIGVGTYGSLNSCVGLERINAG